MSASSGFPAPATPRPAVSVALLRTVAWAGLFTVLAFAGRATIIDGTALSMVWPAAGAAVLWLGTSPPRTWPLVLSVLGLVVVVVNRVTGATWAMCAVLLLANVLETVLVVLLLRTTAPQLYGAGGERPLRTRAELGLLCLATACGSLAGAAVGSLGMQLVVDGWSAADFFVWWGRNSAGTLAVVALGMLLASAPGERPEGTSAGGWLLQRCGRAVTSADRRRMLELAGLVVVTVVLYVGVFVLYSSLPVAFPLLLATLYAGSRFSALVTHLHSLVVSTVVVVLTLNGVGPFGNLSSAHVEALLSQAFVLMTLGLGLAVALARDERSALVAELAAAQRDASERAVLMTTLVSSLSEGVALIDEAGRVHLRNPAGRRLLDLDGPGITPIDRLPFEMRGTDGHLLPLAELPFSRAFAGDVDVRQDLVLRPLDGGAERTISFHVTPLGADLGDGLRRAVVLYQDVTADRAQRDALESFAGVVAHDLNNPLAIVEGWSELLAAELAGGRALEPGEVAPMVAKIQAAAASMHELIDDLLAFTTSHDQALSPVVVDLGAVVRDLTRQRVDAAAPGRPPRFTVGDLPPVYAEPALVRQLLDNLIGNAVKYVAPGSIAEVAVDGTRLSDGWVQVSVTDRGIGIPEEQRERIFDTFHRAHPESYAGTGIGLSICDRIVNRHGGHLGVEENPDGPGSRFVFTLPGVPQD